jgi:phosphate transport system substrate-binding protein
VAAQAFVDDETDVAFIGREMLWGERDLFAARFGEAPRRFPGCGGNLGIPGTTHAVAVFVHSSNPLTSLSLDQLDAIYSTTRNQGHGPIETWGDLGLGGEWADRKITRWGQTPDVGFDRFVQERALKGGRYRDDINLLHQVDTIPERIAEDPSAIGYAGFGHGVDVPGARALDLAEDGTAVPCTRDTVAGQIYPFARRLYLFVPGDRQTPIRPSVRELLRFILSKEGQEQVSEDRLFLPLPANVVASALADLEACP